MADALRKHVAAYRDAIAALPESADQTGRRRYEPLSPRSLTADHGVGVVDLANLRELMTHPSIGRPVAVRGRLAYFDPEELSPLAAPRSYRVSVIDRAAGDDRLWSVFLDIGSLSAGERNLIDRFCDGLLACDVTVSGRIDEVIAERRSNLFSDTGAVTVTIGLIADRIDFLGPAP